MYRDRQLHKNSNVMSVPVHTLTYGRDRHTNGSTEFYKCTNGMYRGQTLQVHYKVRN